MKTVYVKISGKVQGVGYRYNTIKMAEKLQVKGWVRNREDGRVEGVFQGESSQVDELVEWCHQGPRHASVQEVEVSPEKKASLFEEFSIKY